MHDLEAVRSLEADVKTRERSIERSLATGFAQGDGASLLAQLAELRFYGRFLDEVSAIEDDLVT